MIKTTLNYHGYTLTFPHEAPAAVAYMERCDPLPLSELIKSYIVLSEGMKDFNADIVTGELKRKKGQRATTERQDFDIYLLVRDFVDDGYPLKANEKRGVINGETAISKAVEQLYPRNRANKKDAVEAAYKRIKAKHFKSEKG